MPNPSRRDFLKGVGAALGALVLPVKPEIVLREFKQLLEPDPIADPEPYPLEMHEFKTPSEWDWAAKARQGGASAQFGEPSIQRYEVNRWMPDPDQRLKYDELYNPWHDSWDNNTGTPLPGSTIVTTSDPLPADTSTSDHYGNPYMAPEALRVLRKLFDHEGTGEET
ncbi:MAG: twin-arginine translocation signal domain-containing protein [Planctomycetota bacterium]|jgi:hypothetical protein